jgi:hypothetical protein
MVDDYSPMSSTERSRRTRERRGYGLRVVPVEVFESEIDWLVRRGLLREADRPNPYEVGHAIERWIERSVS